MPGKRRDVCSIGRLQLWRNLSLIIRWTSLDIVDIFFFVGFMFVAITTQMQGTLYSTREMRETGFSTGARDSLH